MAAPSYGGPVLVQHAPSLQASKTHIIIILTRSIQPKPPAVAIVHQNGLSSASCRASVAVTPVCVTADLVNPVGGWPTTGTFPFQRREPGGTKIPKV